MYPPNPHLRYRYPPPTPEIMTNMMHAIAALPRLYTQVLHLMNKMNLPPPFAPVRMEGTPEMVCIFIYLRITVERFKQVSIEHNFVKIYTVYLIVPTTHDN